MWWNRKNVVLKMKSGQMKWAKSALFAGLDRALETCIFVKLENILFYYIYWCFLSIYFLPKVIRVCSKFLIQQFSYPTRTYIRRFFFVKFDFTNGKLQFYNKKTEVSWVWWKFCIWKKHKYIHNSIRLINIKECCRWWSILFVLILAFFEVTEKIDILCENKRTFGKRWEKYYYLMCFSNSKAKIVFLK